MYQYYRVAAAVPDMRVADTAYNVDCYLVFISGLRTGITTSLSLCGISSDAS